MVAGLGINRMRCPVMALSLWLCWSGGAAGSPPKDMASHRDPATESQTRLAAGMPSWEQVRRVVLLRDYNTRIVWLGTTLLGIASGPVGVFMLLRRRSLVGDVVSHASLPGIALAFLVAESTRPGTGKSLPVLLAGATAAGLVGVCFLRLLQHFTRLKEDAALAIVLSTFFGFGVALLTLIQSLPGGNAAGLNTFIFGKAASMVAADVWLTGQAAAVILAISVLLFKELKLTAFDEPFAAAQGWPVTALDLFLMALVVGVTVIGLQSVGLLLMVAFLIIPAAAARFWTHDLRWMVWTAAMLGGASAACGVCLSALFPRIAAGAVIVLSSSAFFALSLLFGSQRGMVTRALERRRTQRSVGRTNLLRAFCEQAELRLGRAPVSPEELRDVRLTAAELFSARSWSRTSVRHLLSSAQRAGLLQNAGGDGYLLTDSGADAALRATRNHRLWELYLIEHVDIAPTHVDRDADDIEHLLSPEVIASLERLLSERFPQAGVPPNPHAATPARAG